MLSRTAAAPKILTQSKRILRPRVRTFSSDKDKKPKQAIDLKFDALKAEREKINKMGPKEFDKYILETLTHGKSTSDAQIKSDVQLLEILKLQSHLEKAGLSISSLTPKDIQALVKTNPEFAKTLSQFKSLNVSQYVDQDGNVTTKRPLRPPVRVAVTGASGQIGYALLFRIANGDLLGKDQPVILQLLELPGEAVKRLDGVVMEILDCAFPLVAGVVTGDDPNKVFAGADYALLVGAKPRTKGMERGDLLKENAKIFQAQGKALNDNASRDVKVIVVGNPANTNAMITSHYAPKINPNNITAMTRLDHNRGLAQLALKTNSSVTDIERFAIWGNHSATQYPDISHALIKGKPAREVINDQAWVKDKFIPTVQKRGAEIIAARGASSAASAASAALDHIYDWVHGTNGRWTSMAVPSDGSYGVDKGLWYSFPVTCAGGGYTIVGNIPIDPFSAERMEETRKELVAEKKDLGSIIQ